MSVNKYAALAGTAVYYSLDSGSTWTQLAGIDDITDLPGGDEDDIEISNVDQRLTIANRTASTHSGTTTIDGMTITDLVPGAVVVGAGVPAGTRIVSIGSNSIVVDQQSTATASPTLSFIMADLTEQFRPGWEDPGKVGVDLAFDQANITLVKLYRRFIAMFKVEYSTGDYQTFTGWIKPLKFKGSKKDKVVVNVMLRITGPVTFHAAGT
jgi:hypothetical protein